MAPAAGEVNLEDLNAELQMAGGMTNFRVDGSTAGFANFQILNEGFDLVQRGFTTFANWSKAMLTRFGRGIQEFLAGIWRMVKDGAGDALMNYLQRTGSMKSFVADTNGPLRAPESGMASASGAAQSTEPSPGGLSEAEDYRGQHTAPMRDDGAPLSDVTANGIYPDDIYGPNGLRYYGTGDESMDAAALSVIRRMKGKPSTKITVYRAVPLLESNAEKIARLEQEKKFILKTGKLPESARRDWSDRSQYYTFIANEIDRLKAAPEVLKTDTTIKGGDWVTTVRKYAVDHGKSALNGSYRIESKSVRADELFTNGDSWLEWGFDPKSSASSLPESSRAASGTGFTNLDTSGRTAGFLNTEILAEGADLIRRGFNNFAGWSQAMVTRFGRGIREFLAGLWQQLTSPQTNAARNVRLGGPQGTAPVSVGQGGFIPNPLHKQGEAFRVKAQIGRALLTGSPLPKDFTKVLDATDNERRAVDQTAAMVGRDLEAAVNAHAKRMGKPLADVWAMVEPVMTGRPGALTVLGMLDANLGERARRARNVLDDLSSAVARTMPAGEMRNTILGNLGQWMRRGYAAFDAESGWSFDKVMAAAKAGKLIAGKDAAMILANARAYLQGQNPGATAAEIEADMRDLMDRDTWQSALLGGTVKKAVGSLMRRKDIAPEIRALMGEETNPLHRYLQSAKFQAQLIARHHGQVAMRTIGLATGLLKAARGGVYTVEIPKTGYQWSGLGGTFTTPELMTALENSSGILQDGNSWGGWLVKTLKALGNEAKLNRVALNPDSWLVNVLGGFVSLVQSGDIYATSIVRRLREAGGTIGSTRTAATANALQDAQRALLARLTEQGVIGSSITLADIEASLPRHLLQWVAENETRDRTLGAAQGALIGQSMGRGLGLPGRAAGGAIGAVGGALAGTQNLQKWRQKVAEWTMTKPDNLFRVTGWLTNYETALAAGMQPDAAAKWASERTLNTFPNYNALPAVLREFSRLGLVGSFIAFQHEVYRNTYWNIRYAVREMGSGNAALQARGLQRLAGLTSIAALTFGGGLAALLGMSGAAGADDERNKLFRKWFAAPWERDAVLAFDKFTPESVSYMNTSYLLPQVTIQELAQAASEGVSEGEAVQRVMARLWEQFAASSVHLSPIINAALNVDRNGRPITNRPGVAGALERADSAVATIGEPGFADKMTRIAYALREAERRGRKFSVEQEIKRVFGLRGYERTWDTLVKGRYSRFGSEYQAIREDANRVLGENLPGAQVKAIEEANARIAELEKQRVQFEADMGRLGIEPGIIRAAKKDSAFNALNAVRVRADGKRVEAVTRR